VTTKTQDVPAPLRGTIIYYAFSSRKHCYVGTFLSDLRESHGSLRSGLGVWSGPIGSLVSCASNVTTKPHAPYVAV